LYWCLWKCYYVQGNLAAHLDAYVNIIQKYARVVMGDFTKNKPPLYCVKDVQMEHTHQLRITPGYAWTAHLGISPWQNRKNALDALGELSPKNRDLPNVILVNLELMLKIKDSHFARNVLRTRPLINLEQSLKRIVNECLLFIVLELLRSFVEFVC